MWMTLPRSLRLPPIRRREKAILLVLLLLLVTLFLLFAPGSVAPADAQSWSSSIATTINGSQATPVSVAAGVPLASPPATSPITPTGSHSTASTALVRMNQLDPAQYDSQQSADTWANSACSAAAMTEVIDAYGFAYRIADVLHVEAQIGAITPSLGLTSEAGISNTATLFGFKTSWGHNLSLDQVIAKANSGVPVIVSWPPQTYPGGHIVVVTGGNASLVHLADSSAYDRTSLSRSQFSTWWRGFSAILTPPSDHLAGKPTISASFINTVLSNYHSPAAGQGQALYDLGVKYDIDPVYALAFFMHESRFGTAGMARITHSLGNSRCVANQACVNTSGDECQARQSCYASYASWQSGFEEWYQQMVAYENGALKYYLSKQWIPLTTLQTIIPVYAPTSDGNNEAAYIAAIQHAVATWRSGTVQL